MVFFLFFLFSHPFFPRGGRLADLYILFFSKHGGVLFLFCFVH